MADTITTQQFSLTDTLYTSSYYGNYDLDIKMNTNHTTNQTSITARLNVVIKNWNNNTITNLNFSQPLKLHVWIDNYEESFTGYINPSTNVPVTVGNNILMAEDEILVINHNGIDGSHLAGIPDAETTIYAELISEKVVLTTKGGSTLQDRWVRYYSTTLPPADRKSAITIPYPYNGYVGKQVPITITPIIDDDNMTHIIRASFGSVGNEIETNIARLIEGNLSYTWTIPENFITLVGENEYISGNITCDSYTSMGYYLGQSSISMNLYGNDPNSIGPVFSNYSAYDSYENGSAGITNSGALGYINGKSDCNITIDIYPHTSSTTTLLKNITIINGSETVHVIEDANGFAGGTFEYAIDPVQYNRRTLMIIATDMDDNKSYFGRVLDIYDYGTPAIDLTFTPVNTEGDAYIHVRIINGYSLGPMMNTYILYYRYAPKSESIHSAEWQSIHGIGTGGYGDTVKDVWLYDLDYETEYNFQCYIIDTAYGSKSETKTIVFSGMPLFDWDDNDFCMNVPFKPKEGIYFTDNDKSIYGQSPDGNLVNAFNPSNSNGDLVIGYGHYSGESTDSYLYGNNINLLANYNITCNDTSLIGLINALTNYYYFSPTVTKGSSVSSASCSLTLFGNCLHCRVYASFSASPGTGALSNKLLCSVKFNPEGKITMLETTDGITGGAGTTSGVTMENVVIEGDGTISFDIYLANSATSGYSFMSSFIIPVALDLNAFAEF